MNSSEKNISNPNKKRPSIRKRLRSCFIDAPYDMNVSTLKKLLKSRGIINIKTSQRIPLGNSLEESFFKYISESDLFIVILDPKHPNYNVHFEMGYASGLGKPFLIIVDPTVRYFSEYIRDMPIIRTNVQNEEAIGFALDQILYSPPPSKKQEKKLLHGSRNIRNSADKLLQKLADYGQSITVNDIEGIVISALKEANIIEIARSLKPEAGADLAIWVDELSWSDRNPVLIEIKKRIMDNSQAEHIKNNVINYLTNSNALYAIVLYLEGIPSRQHVLLNLDSFIQFMTVREFLELLRKKNFGNMIRDLLKKRYEELTYL